MEDNTATNQMSGNKKVKPAFFVSSVLFAILIVSVVVNFYQARQLNKQSIEKNSLQERLNEAESKLEKKTEEKSIKTQIDSKLTKLRRCGDLPGNLPGSVGHFTVLSGPEWSPDCRYIAWGIWESGTSWLGKVEPGETFSQATRPLATEGIFLYSDHTNKIKKIYSPAKVKAGNPETPKFIGWKNSDTIIFSIDGKEDKFLDINSMEISNE